MKKRSSKSGNSTMPSNEPKGRARRIFDLENPGPLAVENTGFEEFIEAETKKAGLTVDKWNEKHRPPLSELPWGGGRERNNPGKEEELDALFARGLTAHDTLGLLLIAVRRKVCPAESRKSLEAAVRRAMLNLAGTPIPTGRPPPADSEEVCMAIAPDYFARSVGLRQADQKQTLAALLKAQKGLVDTVDTKDANDKAIRPYARYFDSNKDRLMVRVSDGRYQDQRRKNDFLGALETLRACVDVDVDFIRDNWDTL